MCKNCHGFGKLCRVCGTPAHPNELDEVCRGEESHDWIICPDCDGEGHHYADYELEEAERQRTTH